MKKDNVALNNLKGLWVQKETKRNIIIVGAILGGAIIYGQTREKSETARPKELAAAVSVVATPNLGEQAPGVSTNETHNQLLKKHNANEAVRALENGTSSTPILTNTQKGSVDPLDNVTLDDGKAANPVDTQRVRGGNSNNGVDAQVQAQQMQMQATLLAQKMVELKDKEKRMMEKTEEFAKSFSPTIPEMEYNYTGKRKETAETGDRGVIAAEAATNRSVNGSTASNQQPADVLAGSIWNAVVLTAVNSDEPGPVLAQIVTGPYTGARILGKFEKPANANKVILSFQTFTLPGASKSDGITAYAVDPESARTALASDVDHHYLSRYGAFAAAAFLKGYSQAIAQSGTTQTTSIGPGGVSTSTTYPGLNDQKIAGVAIGEVGNEMASVLKENLKRPATITLNQGTPIGVLVMKDAVLTKN